MLLLLFLSTDFEENSDILNSTTYFANKMTPIASIY